MVIWLWAISYLDSGCLFDVIYYEYPSLVFHVTTVQIMYCSALNLELRLSSVIDMRPL